MTIKRWVELVCSECNESLIGLVFPEDFNANTLRKEARGKGWKVERMADDNGLMFDVCPKCQELRRLTD